MIGSGVFEGAGVEFPTFPLTCVVSLKHSGTTVPACDDVSASDFESWSAQQCAQSRQFAFWSLVKKFELIILSFVQSIRAANFGLHLSSLIDLIPWFFILDYINNKLCSLAFCAYSRCHASLYKSSCNLSGVSIGSDWPLTLNFCMWVDHSSQGIDGQGHGSRWWARLMRSVRPRLRAVFF